MELLEFANFFNEKIGSDNLLEKVLSNNTSVYDDYVSAAGLEHDFIMHYYQYYLAERKRDGADFTPASLSALVAELGHGASTYYDCCAGTGSLTLAVYEKNQKARFICDELNADTIPFLLFNLAVRNISAVVRNADVLKGEVYQCYKLTQSDKYSTVSKCEPIELNADVAISNPPFNMKWLPPLPLDNDTRFELGIPPSNNANYAFLLYCFSVAKKAVLILPNGVLSTGNKDEKAIIQNLVTNQYIEGIITCPQNMFESTSINTCVMSITRKPNNLITLIDHRNDYIETIREQRGQYGGAAHINRTYKKLMSVLDNEMILDIKNAINEHKQIQGYCASVTASDVQKQEYILAPSRYIQYTEKEIEHRSYPEIVRDLHRVIIAKNQIRININETVAKSLGQTWYEAAVCLKKSNELDKTLDNLLKNLGCDPLPKEQYLTITKDMTGVVITNKCKKAVQDPLIMDFLRNWSFRIQMLNAEENTYLAELRDALLPGLMDGSISITEKTEEAVKHYEQT